MGVFGKRLFERSEFPIDAHEAEQRRKQAVGGSLFFGFFLLAKQKKETRTSRDSDHLLTAQCLSVIAPYSGYYGLRTLSLLC